MKSLPLFSRTGNVAAPAKKCSGLERLIHAIGVGRLAWISCVVSMLALGLGIVMNRQADLRHTIEEIDARVSLNAKGYSKFVALTLTVIDQQLVELRDLRALGRKLPSQQDLNARLGAVQGLLLQVSVADAAGLVIDSSQRPTRGLVNIADRPYFQAVQNNATDELFISQPVVGRLTEQFSLQLVRPILAADGSFAGALIASIDPQLLQGYFSDRKVLEQHGLLSIIGTDGVARFRLSASGFSAGHDIRALPQWHAISTRRSGTYQSVSSIDEVDRRLAYHQVEGYPLLVMVGSGFEEEMADFHNRWRLIAGLALVLAVMLFVVAKTVSRLAVEQKSSYALLLQSRAKEVESNAIKSNFLASVSHELRTPLNSILGFSELIRDTGQDQKISQYAGLIYQSGTQLHALVNTILDLARIESGKMGLTVETVNIPELLQTLTAVFKVNADRKKVELSLSLPAGGRKTVASDRTKLVQVFHHVIDNAIKFTPAGAISVVLQSHARNGLIISVIDSGVGMSADHLTQAFERFNTSAAVESGGEGPHLGLALCRQLLGLMGGTIGLVSKEGRGTTVEIFIPYELPSPAAST